MNRGESSITVMVTGLGGGCLGEPLIKALRMAHTPYTIVGGVATPYSTGLPLADISYVLPMASDPGYMDALLAVCERHSVRALFPGSDAELKVLSLEQDRLHQAGIFFPVNPQAVIDICMDKVRMFECLERLQGEIGRFPEVTEYCKRVALALDARSAINIQCRMSDTGETFIFEINPRFSGTTSMRAMVGYNEPDALIRKHLLGQFIEEGFAYQSGTALRRLEEVFIPDEPDYPDTSFMSFSSGGVSVPWVHPRNSFQPRQ